PVIASTTRRDSTGWTTSATSAISRMSASSTVSRPAVSRMTTSRLSRRAASTPPRATSTTDVPAVARWTGTSSCRPSVSSCSAAALHDLARQLGRRGRLARALEAGEEDDGRAAPELERPIARRQERGELLVDDAGDLLAGGQALEDLGADRTFADTGDEVLDDLEVHVRLEQCEADLTHRRVDVLRGHAAAARQRGERRAQAFAQCIEHAEEELQGTTETGEPAARRAVRGFWRHRGSGSVAHGRERPGYAVRMAEA